MRTSRGWLPLWPDRLAPVAPVPTLAASLSAARSVSLQEIGSRQADAQVRAHSLLSGLPLRFEPNQGQGNLDSADPRAKFVARGSGFGLFLGAEGATLTLLSRDHSTPNSACANRRSPNEVVRGQSGCQRSRLSIDFQARATTCWAMIRGSGGSGVPQYAGVRYETCLSRHQPGLLRQSGATRIRLSGRSRCAIPRKPNWNSAAQKRCSSKTARW